MTDPTHVPLAELYTPKTWGDFFDAFGQHRADDELAVTSDIDRETSAKKSRKARAEANEKLARSSPTQDRLTAMGITRAAGADGARARLAERNEARPARDSREFSASRHRRYELDPSSAATALENPDLVAMLRRTGVSAADFEKHGRGALAKLRARHEVGY